MGSVFRIKRDPAKLLGNAVARSTAMLDAGLSGMKWSRSDEEFSCIYSHSYRG